ncbi:type IX secretion system plug protein [Flavobacterium humi]|uniref:DUF5103 domain-containing protein n=1 Tax=Flavobacterium humi TaxID=2562683 RepID=A0A4Z0L5R6_9FLAO|nr:DUF5103 domain-containing protein [Flavobacterium humi]TGD57732.1 DUF5103 domain-containing protein [Flavobacterium humi]
MLQRLILFFSAIIVSCPGFGQDIETAAPFNIKTITFTQNANNTIPVFRLGEQFQFSFDDLYGNEEDYYYTITHFNYNWTPSELAKGEYLDGIDNQRIQDYENSFNTLQIYSHYRLKIPNNFTRLTKSGNYLLSIFNGNKELVFSKKFIMFEELSEVPMQIKRARKVADMGYKQNLEFTIKSKSILFQNPAQNVKVILFQNGKWNNAIVNVKPQYTIGNDLIFKYDKETQFYAGNEYLYFDNKEIRASTNTISRVDSNSGLYNTHLYTDMARKNNGYTYFPDINGNFQTRNLTAQNNEVEADYTWVYFSLFSAETQAAKSVYVTGMFNNYVLGPENKMDYNTDKGIFEKAILIKQGFTNYNYTIVGTNNAVADNEAVDGNFYQTENQYTAIVYYRANGERYDRVIGKGEANSENITN